MAEEETPVKRSLNMDSSERLCIHDKKTTTPHVSYHIPHCTYSVHTTDIPYRLTALYIHTTIYATQHITRTIHTYMSDCTYIPRCIQITHHTIHIHIPYHTYLAYHRHATHHTIYSTAYTHCTNIPCYTQVTHKHTAHISSRSHTTIQTHTVSTHTHISPVHHPISTLASSRVTKV